MKVEFFDRSSKNTQLSNFMKIHSVGAEFFHTDGRIDGHDEATSRFSLFCERTLKSTVTILTELSGAC
jgi:hypothetical protein